MRISLLMGKLEKNVNTACSATICLSSLNVLSYLENRFPRLNSFTLVQELILICIKAFQGFNCTKIFEKGVTKTFRQSSHLIEALNLTTVLSFFLEHCDSWPDNWWCQQKSGEEPWRAWENVSSDSLCVLSTLASPVTLHSGPTSLCNQTNSFYCTLGLTLGLTVITDISLHWSEKWCCQAPDTQDTANS